jgi:hypothetical protein
MKQIRTSGSQSLRSTSEKVEQNMSSRSVVVLHTQLACEEDVKNFIPKFSGAFVRFERN